MTIGHNWCCGLCGAESVSSFSHGCAGSGFGSDSGSSILFDHLFCYKEEDAADGDGGGGCIPGSQPPLGEEPGRCPPLTGPTSWGTGGRRPPSYRGAIAAMILHSLFWQVIIMQQEGDQD